MSFAGWQTADSNVHTKTRRRLANGMELQRRQAKASKKLRSTPAVVPGAAPAMAKAGVGGYIYIYTHILHTYLDLPLVLFLGPLSLGIRI